MQGKIVRGFVVGHNVELEVVNLGKKTGNITEILARKNALLRPAVANIDQALVIFAADKPKPNFNLLDRFLIMMEHQQVETIICFNKQDLVHSEELHNLQAVYEACGYRILFASAAEEEGLEEIRKVLEHKTTTVAGPSGWGNLL